MRRAGDRGSYEELPRLGQVYAGFAGEIWTDAGDENAYWFRSTHVPLRPMVMPLV